MIMKFMAYHIFDLPPIIAPELAYSALKIGKPILLS